MRPPDRKETKPTQYNSQMVTGAVTAWSVKLASWQMHCHETGLGKTVVKEINLHGPFLVFWLLSLDAQFAITKYVRPPNLSQF